MESRAVLADRTREDVTSSSSRGTSLVTKLIAAIVFMASSPLIPGSSIACEPPCVQVVAGTFSPQCDGYPGTIMTTVTNCSVSSERVYVRVGNRAELDLGPLAPGEFRSFPISAGNLACVNGGEDFDVIARATNDCPPDQISFDQVHFTCSSTGTYCRDADGDGYGDIVIRTTGPCGSPPTGYVIDNTDCDDTHATVHPGASELCDALDNDCNGQVDEINGHCPCVEPPANLVSWWPGNGDATDVRGGHNGTLQNGATYATGNVAQAFSLDGVDDYVSVPHNPAFNIAHSLTVMAWIKTSAGLDRYIITKSEDSFYFAIGGGYVALNKISLFLNGVWPSWITGTSVVTDNQWHHVVGVRDWENGLVQLYVDGVQETSVPRGGASISHTGTSPILIGTRPSANDNEFKFQGLLDEVQLFDRALSASEIQAIYDAGPVGVCSPALVAVQDPPATTRQFAFATPWPNPVTRNVNFDFQLPAAASVQADVFDVVGRRVATLVVGQSMGAGEHRVTWDGSDRSGLRVAPGIYEVRITAGSAVAIRKIVMIE